MSLNRAPGSEHEVFQMKTPGEPVGSVALPVRDHLSAGTTTALMMTDWASWLGPDQTIDRFLIQGGILTLQRNESVQRMKGDWLLFIDDDMVWQPDAIRRLVEVREEHDLDMVGALCFRRSEPYQPTLYMRESKNAGAYNYLESWDSDVIEVDATGMAFMLIHKRVFEKIAGVKMPPSEERMRLGPPNFFRWDGTLGEDLRFCQDAKAAGCKIWVDTRVEIGHVSEITVRHKDFLRQLALRPQDVVEIRQKVNDKMGFPTMTREDALRALEL